MDESVNSLEYHCWVPQMWCIHPNNRQTIPLTHHAQTDDGSNSTVDEGSVDEVENESQLQSES